MEDDRYVHGYSRWESERLHDQAGTLAGLLHYDTRYPAGRKVLEAGCGVGAQTVILAGNSPEAEITSIDISPSSIALAEDLVRERGMTNVIFLEEDIFALPFEPGRFDDVFVCFLLEHLEEPVEALRRLGEVLKPGGTITVIEGDHGSAFFHPDSERARAAIRCLIDLQADAGGDSLIGRRLNPLMREAGLRDVRVSPRFVYADASRPGLVEGFTLKTFTVMVEGARERALSAGLIAADDFDGGIRDLKRAAEPGGVFCYTFFKGTAVK
jgi:SAM-dependent methyltransferase